LILRTHFKLSWTGLGQLPDQGKRKTAEQRQDDLLGSDFGRTSIADHGAMLCEELWKGQKKSRLTATTAILNN